MLLVNLVVMIGVGLLLYRGVRAITNYQGATNAATPIVKIPSTPIAVLGTTDANNSLSSLTLFVSKPKGALGGTVISLPVSVDTSGGVGTKASLADVYRSGGTGALYDAIDSVLGLTVDAHRIDNPDAMQAFLKPIEPFAVTLPDTVSTTSNGQTVPLYARGPNTFNAFKWTTTLNAKVDGFSERSRRGTLAALWNGFADRVNQRPIARVQGLPTGSVDDIVNRVIAGPVETRVLPANRFRDGVVPPESDIEQLDRTEEVMVMAALAPGSLSATNAGLSFRIEAPKGSEAKVKEAIGVLLFLHGNVRSVYIGTEPHDSTWVYSYDQATATKLMESMRVFGAIESKDPTFKIDGVDVVLQLGNSPIGDPSKFTTTTSAAAASATSTVAG
jgi:hypothetical protein